MKNKSFIKGVFVGLIAPIAAFIVYVAYFTKDSDPLQTYLLLVEMDKISHVISLSVLINLVIFFMNLKTYRDEAARGILLATILYALSVVILKVF